MSPATTRANQPGARRRLVIEADGGSRGNPGVAGYGALVRDPVSGRVLIEMAEPLGKQSNNVAEYSGLLAGLRAIVDLDPSADVVARMDSKLVVEQMSGRWKIKHEDMRRLALEARDLCAKIGDAGGSVSFEWIPREKNKAADALSNDAMDGKSIHRVLHDTDAHDAAAQADSAVAEGSEERADVVAHHKPLRLLLVQVPLVEAAVPLVVAAALRLVGPGAEVVTCDEPLALEVARAVGAEVGTEPTVSGLWAGRAPGEDADERVRTAYRSLAARGGTVVAVTSRRGVLSVLTDVLETPGHRFWAIATAPGSLTAVEVWEDGSAAVAFTNRTEHLA
ncbi:MAG TPA: reverse transcriptase-like protein [Humibacillus xanthopallidus]|nr:reverse transcriptase-like protein [Humibacillus xanthopallidus]